jgi:hypothetical protein
MLATTMSSSSPLDSLLARIQSLLDDLSHPGFGTIVTSADGASVEITMKSKTNETFQDFARRVLDCAGDTTVIWTMQDRKVPMARFTRKLS